MDNDILTVLVSLVALFAGFLHGVGFGRKKESKKHSICAGCGNKMNIGNDIAYPYCSNRCKEVIEDYLNEQK